KGQKGQKGTLRALKKDVGQKNAESEANARRTRKRARSLLVQMRSDHRPFCVFWRWGYLTFESGKNAKSRMNARNTRKRPPQFT
ncbi:MAG: hypothetical protein IKJ46_05685, partial [Tidjanibacter sp.]|nr:hypothetical protein [Tidjanibacter sp.]